MYILYSFHQQTYRKCKDVNCYWSYNLNEDIKGIQASQLAKYIVLSWYKDKIQKDLRDD